mmetsp:Transcript_30335/g.96811  ORF Transcript_30335/g.96811 Transcript_30335/m.96811 type:complete len:224 (+) Transcript_30335:1575-2246(+)
MSSQVCLSKRLGCSEMRGGAAAEPSASAASSAAPIASPAESWALRMCISTSKAALRVPTRDSDTRLLSPSSSGHQIWMRSSSSDGRPLVGDVGASAGVKSPSPLQLALDGGGLRWLLTTGVRCRRSSETPRSRPSAMTEILASQPLANLMRQFTNSITSLSLAVRSTVGGGSAAAPFASAACDGERDSERVSAAGSVIASSYAGDWSSSYAGGRSSSSAMSIS